MKNKTIDKLLTIVPTREHINAPSTEDMIRNHVRLKKIPTFLLLYFLYWIEYET